MSEPRTAASECPECGAELRVCLHFADAYRYLLSQAEAAAPMRAALERIVTLLAGHETTPLVWSAVDEAEAVARAALDAAYEKEQP